MHLRENLVMQQAALLRAKQLDIDDTPFQQGRDRLHGFVIGQRIENALAASVSKIHILVGKNSTVLTRAKIEHGDKAQLVMNRQYPADHTLAIQRDPRAPGSEIWYLVLLAGYSFRTGLESGA